MNSGSFTQVRPGTGQACQLLCIAGPLSAQTCNYLQFCTCHGPRTMASLVSWVVQTVRHSPSKAEGLGHIREELLSSSTSHFSRERETVMRRES